MSIRTRLTLWYAAALMLIVVALSTVVVLRLRVDLIHEVDASLVTRSQSLTLALEDPSEPNVPIDREELELQGRSKILNATNVVQLYQPSGATHTTIGSHIRLLTTPQVKHLRLPAFVSRSSPDYRMYVTRLSRTKDVLVVAQPLDVVNATIRRMLLLLAIAIPAAIGLSVGGGYLLARRALGPIDRMTSEAARMGAEDSTSRLDIGPIGDEVGRLGRTLNGMLDRLHGAILEQRRFAADASHELRTPLAIMQAELDVALRSRTLPESSRPVLASLSEEVVRMSVLVDNLLTLALADEGRLPLALRDVDVSAIARDACNRLAKTAEAKGSRIDLTTSDGEATVVGDGLRLGQLVTNLVENALKYTPAGGTIRVRVTHRTADVEIEVGDDGPGIPATELSHIFDRFYRVDKARSRTAGGTGLGLAICKAIVDAHHGTITATSVVGQGATFTAKLPSHAAATV